MPTPLRAKPTGSVVHVVSRGPVEAGASRGYKGTVTVVGCRNASVDVVPPHSCAWHVDKWLGQPLTDKMRTPRSSSAVSL